MTNSDIVGLAEHEPPKAICGYPLTGWRLDHVQWDERAGQPDGWIVSLKRESPDWRTDRRSVCVMARSDIGPLEAWDEALRIALREDARDAARTSMEAREGLDGEAATARASSEASPKASRKEGP